MAPRVETIADVAALDALAPAWERLWRADPRATPFQHPAWLLPWWRHCGGGPLRVLLARRDDELTALLPLFEHRGTLYPLGVGLSDYHDVLGEADLLEALPGRAELPELRPGSPLLAAPAPRGWGSDVEASSVCPVLRLPGGLARRKAQDCRRVSRIAATLGTVEAAHAANGREHIEALIRLHAAQWAGRGETGVLADPKLREFHLEAAPLLLAAGIARLYAFRHEGVIVASWYGFAAHGRAYFYIGGVDPAFARHSLGTVLVGHAIDEAIGEGCEEFDFLRGAEPYKHAWGAADRQSFRRILTP